MRRFALVLFLATLLPSGVGALEPVDVRVEGVALIEDDQTRALREVFGQALVEAVLEVAGQMVSPDALASLSDEDLERLKQRAPGFVLTFRPLGNRNVPSMEHPGEQEAVLELAATVDAEQVRSWLGEVGLIASQGRKPSVALLIRGAGRAFSGDPGLFSGFEESLVRALEAKGYVPIDPALAPQPGRGNGAVDFARRVGADIGIDIAISASERWLRDALLAVTTEVRVTARRSADSIELASSRFSAPGYHRDRDEALLRGLDSLRGQVADNLVQQLEQNWRELSSGRDPLRLRLANLTSQAQVEAVQARLLRGLGAKRADLVEIAPATAELEIDSRLSPGALRDRLAGADFDSFRLEPVSAGGEVVQLRVEAVEPLDDSLPPGLR